MKDNFWTLLSIEMLCWRALPTAFKIHLELRLDQIKNTKKCNFREEVITVFVMAHRQ